MAQLYTDFSEYDTGNITTQGWTQRFASFTWAVAEKASATGGKVLRASGSGTGRRALSWDAAGSPATCEIVARFMCPSTSSLSFGGILLLRGSGASGSESGYRLMQNGSNAELWVFNGGSASQIGSLSRGFASNTWLWYRLQADGINMRSRAWADGVSEPSTWGIETTNSALASGWLGATTNSATTVEWDIIGVGTDGDPAPTEPVTGGGDPGSGGGAAGGVRRFTQPGLGFGLGLD